MPKKTPTIKKKIWFKNKTVKLNKIVEQYNAGEDILYDQEMIPDDVWCSRCYARLLQRHKLLTKKELVQLEKRAGRDFKIIQTGKIRTKTGRRRLSHQNRRLFD